MLFAYAMVNAAQGRRSELCIIPRKVSPENPPVPVRDLVQSDCALFYIGGDEVQGQEAVAVRTLPENSGIEIKPIRPAILFVTSHNPDRPGDRAEGVIVKINEKGEVIAQIKKNAAEDWVAFSPGPRFFSMT